MFGVSVWEQELAELAGGPGALADRALKLLAEVEDPGTGAGTGDGTGDGAGDGALRVAGHLAELAWLATPGDTGIQQARHRIYSARAERATSTMAHGVFRWAAGESLGSG